MSAVFRRIFLFLLVFLAAMALASCGTAAKVIVPPAIPASVSVSVSPTSANIRAGTSYNFSASVTGSSNTAVTWSVNSTTGGSPTLGTIDASGKYTAPATLSSPNTVTITATSSANTSKSSSSAVTLLNPTPTLSGISPASTNLGNFSLSVTGSQFVSGAQVLLNGTTLSTTLVSSTQLTATGNASTAGTFIIAVENPDPGSSTSSSLNFQVNGSVQTSNCSQMSTGQGGSLGGFVPFPSDNLWNKDISSAPVDPNSVAFINYIGPTIGLHPDFGAGQYNGSYQPTPHPH
jgi:hypothetical protein